MISFIAAVSKNHVIGRRNKLPWRQREDYLYYKRKVMGHKVVMGRTTFEIVGKAITDKEVVVVSRERDFRAEGVTVVHSIEDALPTEDDEVMVLGGGAIYSLALPFADRMYITEIDVEVPDGDTFFPEFDKSQWVETSREHHVKDDKNQYDYDFVVYDRKK